MRLSFLLLAFLFFSTSSFAQSLTDFIEVKSEHRVSINASARGLEGGYVMIGTIETPANSDIKVLQLGDSLVYPPREYLGVRYRFQFLASFNASGGLKWVKFDNGFSNVNNPRDLKVFDNGDIYMLSNGRHRAQFGFDEAGLFLGEDMRPGYAISKFDKDGDFLWFEEIPANNFDQNYLTVPFINMELTLDEHGTAYVFPKIFTSAKEEFGNTIISHSTFLWVVNCDGKTVLNKELPSINTPIGNDNEAEKEVYNNEVVSLKFQGNRFHLIRRHLTASGVNQEYEIMELDLEGNALWSKYFGVGVNITSVFLKSYEDHLYVAGGYAYDYFDYDGVKLISGVSTDFNGSGGADNAYPFILKLDRKGELVKSFMPTELNSIVGLEISNCGQLYVLRRHLEFFDNDLNITSQVSYSPDFSYNIGLELGENRLFLREHGVPYNSSIYAVSINNNCNPQPIIESLDVQFCATEVSEIGLDYGDSFSYSWKLNLNDLGESSPKLTPSVSGEYRLEIKGPCNEVIRTIAYGVSILEVKEAPMLSSSGDVYVCTNNLIITAIGDSNSTFVWSTGETGKEITISEHGEYWVKSVNELGCESENSDTVRVFFEAPPVQPAISVSGPIEFCEGEQVILTSDVSENIIWSTGETTKSITVTESGNYSVWQQSEICGNGEPSEEVQVVVYPVPDQPLITVSGDTQFCEGNSVTLSTSAVGNLTWSNGQTGSSIEITSSGEYTLYVERNGCISQASDPINIIVDKDFQFDITSDTTVCEGVENLELKPNISGGPVDYNWSDGSTSSTLVVDEAGSYWLEVSNGTCEKPRVLIEVSEACYPKVYIPTAFSPNADGVNDAFQITGIRVVNFELSIFNAWGNQVFRSNSMDDSWKGTYNGELLSPGKYSFKLVYGGELNGQPIQFVKSGVVNLVR